MSYGEREDGATVRFDDGRVFVGTVVNGKPCGWGTMTEGEGKPVTGDFDASGNNLDGKMFVKNHRSGYLKFYAMSGGQQGMYQLLYLGNTMRDDEFVDPDTAKELELVGGVHEASQRKRKREDFRKMRENMDRRKFTEEKEQALVALENDDGEARHALQCLAGLR
jgi:hypothetical protein